jgi:hypothetical protein
MKIYKSDKDFFDHLAKLFENTKEKSSLRITFKKCKIKNKNRSSSPTKRKKRRRKKRRKKKQKSTPSIGRIFGTCNGWKRKD